MHSIVLSVVVLTALVACEPTVFRSYHDEVGFPEAARILAEEKVVLDRMTRSVNFEARIVGGVISPANAHPYLAGLLISIIGEPNMSICGSTLISPSRLVTAAHCWEHGVRQSWRLEVVLGSNFISSGGTRVITETVITHPLWNRFSNTLENDVAMIYLPRNIAYNQNIEPASLPFGAHLHDDFAESIAVASGWGRTTDLQEGGSSIVSQVALRVISEAECRIVWTQYVFPSTLCTSGVGGVGVCGGDSGGPLVVEHYGQRVLIGISSFSAPRAIGCEAGLPSGYARVTSFMSFIQQHVF